ncbi:hypothetical protein [Deinococcus arenicola]|uniref:Thiol:disulfide interchange protein DsbD N-terminal domain-containing protein n=1 Tax=Deinococcus arenicola TaxID=2994950 RepID=A0ABU4DTU1_9DEIO|nr:hypothetical protein [Deinococcus sp. ZS9-10]MDV6375835.1 hypothetical protein [Deinococcus sp. ZS9-10]
MNRAAQPLFLCLLLGLGAGQAAGQASNAQAVAQAGQTATLSVNFGLRELLLNRDAPNIVRLATPWGQTSGGVGGTGHPDAKFSSYYSSVRPVGLRVRVPAGTRPGIYPAKLSAQLFTCDQKRGLCAMRETSVAVNVQVLAAGEVRQNRPLRLTDELLASPLRFR